MSRWKAQSGRRFVHESVPVVAEGGRLVYTGGAYRQEVLSAADLLDPAVFDTSSVDWLQDLNDQLQLLSQRVDSLNTIGKPWLGFDQTEPYGVLFLDGGIVDGADEEYSEFADWLLAPQQTHLVDEQNLAAFYVDPATRSIRLPDFRGLGLRIAGQSSAFTMSNGQPYDAGQALTVLLDQMQGHWHWRNPDKRQEGVRLLISGSLTFAPGPWTVGHYVTTGDAVEDRTSGPPRTGSETRMATVSIQVGVYYK